MRRLPNVVLPLLLSDLPVVFWWPGEAGLRDPFLFDMLAPAQRFVVDTVGFVHVERALITLDALRRRPGVSVDLADLNWGRLLPWRELIAQFWDVAPWRTHLSRLDRIEIELTKPTPGRSNRPQALLLAGWLASRLKWTPQYMERRADGYKLTAKRRGGPVEVLIHITAGESAGLRAVRFFRDRGRQAAFAVTAGQGDSATMTVQIGGVDTYQRTARIERLEEPELLAHDLDMATGETIFEDALGAAASFLRSS